jgi:hypothetical protein
MSRGLSRTNKSREVFHQFADIVDFMSSNGLAREETSINLRPAPSSHYWSQKWVQKLLSAQVVEFLTQKRCCRRSSSIFVVLTLTIFSFSSVNAPPLTLLRRSMIISSFSYTWYLLVCVWCVLLHQWSCFRRRSGRHRLYRRESKNRCRITFLIFTTEGVRGTQNRDNQYLSRSGNGGWVIMTMTMTRSDLWP